MSHRTVGVSDAYPAVAAQMAAAEPWPEAVVIDASEDEPITEAGGELAGVAGPVRRAMEAVRPHGPDDLWRPVRPYLLPG